MDHRVRFDPTQQILCAAVEAHRELGPGLLESADRTCLGHQLQSNGLEIQREVPVAISERGLEIQCSYRADLVVARRVLIELKAVERLLPIHEAQLLTYLK